MLRFLRRSIPDTHPIRLFYHRAVAVLAAFFYRFPAHHLIVIAVTGTNGKSTTCQFLARILEEAGEKTGVSSSVFFQVGNTKWDNTSKITTFGRFTLQGLLRKMVCSKCKYAIIETTSHAMTQSRLWGVNVDMAVLTNISRDHIEYHGGFRKYVEAKGMLFSRLRKESRKPGGKKISVINRDIEEFSFFNAFVADRVLTYGLNKKANYFADDISLMADGSRFRLKVPNDEVIIELKIPGKFNVYNALCAATCAMGLGVKLPVIKKALESVSGLPGRLEAICEGQDFSVIVDYAHTPDALDALCAMFKELTRGRLFVVFGATGGGRDKAKRPKMGEAVDKSADCIIVTNDDPYEEDEFSIIGQVSSGIRRREGENFWKIIDREEAIRTALFLAKEGDTVVIAGKGCEQVIWKKEGKIPYDDRKVVRKILAEILSAKS